MRSMVSSLFPLSRESRRPDRDPAERRPGQECGAALRRERTAAGRGSEATVLDADEHGGTIGRAEREEVIRSVSGAVACSAHYPRPRGEQRADGVGGDATGVSRDAATAADDAPAERGDAAAVGRDAAADRRGPTAVLRGCGVESARCSGRARRCGGGSSRTGRGEDTIDGDRGRCGGGRRSCGGGTREVRRQSFSDAAPGAVLI
jgi:hypothetical protein